MLKWNLRYIDTLPREIIDFKVLCASRRGTYPWMYLVVEKNCFHIGGKAQRGAMAKWLE